MLLQNHENIEGTVRILSPSQLNIIVFKENTHLELDAPILSRGRWKYVIDSRFHLDLEVSFV